MSWTVGNNSNSTVLTDDDDIYPVHINELRNAFIDRFYVVVGFQLTCDYVTDGTADNVQIQAAIDYVSGLGGGVVFIRGGNYITNAVITVPDNINIFGEGYATYIKSTTVSNVNVFKNSDQTNGNSNIEISNIRIDGGGEFKTAGAPHGISFIGVDNFSIKDNYIMNCLADGIYTQATAGGTQTNDGVIRDNKILNVGRNGISCVGAGDLVIDGNRIKGTDTYFSVLGYYGAQRGIDVEGGVNESLIITNNIIDGFKSQGLQIDNPSSGTNNSKRVKITGNIVKNYIDTSNVSTDEVWGISIFDRATNYTTDSLIANNSVYNVVSTNIANKVYGIQVGTFYPIIISNNHIQSVYGNTTGSGIIVSRQSVSVTGSLIGNIIDDCFYGINIEAGATGVFASLNRITNVRAGGSSIANAGTASIIRNNQGYITENSGTGTIASGATTAVVTHGLSVTPTLDDLSIVFGEQGTSDYGRWWISSITSTQFTLNVSADPSTSGLDFAWKAIVL